MKLLIAASQFAPDITIISAGFDAARGDPLGCCDVRILRSCFFLFNINFTSEGWIKLACSLTFCHKKVAVFLIMKHGNSEFPTGCNFLWCMLFFAVC